MNEEQLNMLLRYIDLRAAIEAREAVHQPASKHGYETCEHLKQALYESVQIAWFGSN